ncbi:hypothetical protein K469DRAFT_715746 [Zopfia rhizophila CBS 207.26]|uniref:Uncharacterized protein n=1 Tax=Zopfia rhizophila CBS 207.26 TaxID=1314779 RepID=A0A6A6DPH0_9PEZI|nr:hypothetical protein K469DRAFT_715746 [Zopfia rhizophila CBS 207.26]
MTLNQAIIASELERSHLKILTHCDHADTLGKALNTSETKLNKARDELAELYQLLNNTLKRVADQENKIKTLKDPANQYLLILIRIVRESEQLVSYQYMVDRLERTYGDPHKRLNARRDFQKLYLRDPANFTQSRPEAERLTRAATTAILPIPIPKPASCYNYGKPSHFTKDCRLPTQATAKVIKPINTDKELYTPQDTSDDEKLQLAAEELSGEDSP